MNRINSEKKVKISRILQIDTEIRSGRYPNSEYMAKKMEVNSRTIKRYIDYLKKYYKAPIEYSYAKKGFYYAKPNFFISAVMLTKEEHNIVMDDLFLKENENEEENNDEYLNLKEPFSKILGIQIKDQSKYLQRSKFNKFEYENEFLSQPFEINKINELNKAIENKKITKIDYWISEKRDYSLQSLNPLHVFFKRHQYYLLALKNNSDEAGIYAIAKIRKIHITDSNFQTPEKRVISDFLNDNAEVFPSDNKIYYVELLFPGTSASLAIEKTYAKDQTVKLLEDGSVSVSFRSNELFEIFYWILEQGSTVKVLNPPELAEMVKMEMEKIIKYYS